MQRDFLRIARECQTRGHRVRIYAIRWEGPLPDDMELVLAPVKAFTNHRLYERFARWVRVHLAGFPVDLVVGMNKMPGLDAYYAADSCYEDKARTQRPAVYRWLSRYRLFSRFERAVWSRESTTEILTISDVQTPLYKRYYATPDRRLHALPPGIERDRIAPADKTTIRREVRAERGIAEHTSLLLFLGSGFIKKGLDRVIAGIAALAPDLRSNVRLLVIGDDNGERFAAQIETEGLKDRVHFLGGREDIPRFLFAADGLVLPAHDENTGIVILEAIVAGLPALVTENCGYAHYLKEADAGLVTPAPFDPQRFSEQLAELLTSPQRERWSRNGVAFAAYADIYDLVPRAVDALETIARKRSSDERTVAFCLFKYFPYGGLQRDFLRVASKCREIGLRTRIYTLSWQGELPDGVEVRLVPVGGVTNHRRYQRYIDWVLEDLERHPADCVVGFNKMPGLDLYYAADACYEEKAHKLRTRLYRTTARYRFFAEAERSVFAPSSDTHVLLLADRQRLSFQRYYATPDERFTVLPPGVAADRRAPDDADEVRRLFRAEQGLEDDDRLLLLVGSGFITKGLDRAISALAHLPGDLKKRTRLIAIGQDNPTSFERLAERLGVDGAVQILPGRDDIPRFLLGADVLVHPAYQEAGGMVLIEAIVSGLPAIATDVCGYASYIARADAGLVVPSPYDETTFVAMLTRMLRDDAARARWRRNGVAFGRSEDLYSLPDRAAAIIAAAARRRHVETGAQGPRGRASAFEGCGRSEE